MAVLRRLTILRRLVSAFSASIAAIVCVQSAMGVEPTLEDIRAVVIRHADSIQTMEGKQEAKSTSDRSGTHSFDLLAQDDPTVVTEFKYDRVNNRTYLIESKTWFNRIVSQESFQISGEISSFDGQLGYHLTKTLASSPFESEVPPNVPIRLRIHSTDETRASHTGVWNLAGMPCAILSHATLAYLLGRHDARIMGNSNINGHQCVKVAIGNGNQNELHLDPSASYLPRRISSIGHEVLEFQQFWTPNGESIWFPSHGRIGSTELRLLNIRFNSPMSEEDFRINPEELPDGVQVHAPNKSFYSGGREDLWQKLEGAMTAYYMKLKLEIEKKRPSSPTTSVPVAVAKEFDWLVFCYIVVAAIVITIGLRRARKQREPST